MKDRRNKIQSSKKTKDSRTSSRVKKDPQDDKDTFFGRDPPDRSTSRSWDMVRARTGTAS